MHPMGDNEIQAYIKKGRRVLWAALVGNILEAEHVIKQEYGDDPSGGKWQREQGKGPGPLTYEWTDFDTSADVGDDLEPFARVFRSLTVDPKPWLGASARARRISQLVYPNGPNIRLRFRQIKHYPLPGREAGFDVVRP